ncbi:MAG TPA: hypothetical protein VF157_15290, partial [Chloroflexota bacterium]
AAPTSAKPAASGAAASVAGSAAAKPAASAAAAGSAAAKPAPPLPAGCPAPSAQPTPLVAAPPSGAPAAKPSFSPPPGITGEPAPGPYQEEGRITVTAGQPAKLQAQGLVWVNNTLVVKAGQKVDVSMTNCSAFAHAFVSPSLGVNDKVDLPAAADNVSFSFTAPSTPGKYMFWCPVQPPGGLSHASRGETGMVIVE